MNVVSQAIIRPTIELMERGLVPEFIMRKGIRRLLRQRLETLNRSWQESNSSLDEFNDRFLSTAWEAPLAIATDKANEQHYEVPAAFFDLVLGPRRKYSSCYFDSFSDDLAAAEETSLRMTCQNAQIENGMDILELGCGWGSLTLWMAEHFPDSNIVALSNSRSQREFILRQASGKGLDSRLEVITCDIKDFQIDRRFDRIVSVEMFEHVRNHRQLLDQGVAHWLRPDGKLLVHIFCHRSFCYPFETEGASNWMGKYFFTGGMMPDQRLMSRASTKLEVDQSWVWNGRHYERTCNLWAANLDRHAAEARAIFRDVYGIGQETRWLYRWKLFFLACAELFGTSQGNEWFVQHTRLTHRND